MVGALEALIHFQSNLDVNLSEQALYFEEQANWNSDDSCAQGGGYDVVSEASYLLSQNYVVPLESLWDYNPSYCINTTDDSSSCVSNCQANNPYSSVYPEYCSDNESQGQYVCDSSTSQCGYLSYVNPSNTQGAILTQFTTVWNQDSSSTDASASTLDTVISYLNLGFPVLASINLTTEFMNSTNGIVPDPSGNDFYNNNDTTAGLVGAHAVLIVGFIPSSQITSGNGFSYPSPAATSTTNQFSSSSASGIFIIKNSWGPSNGDAGFYYVSDQFLTNAATEFVAITGVNFNYNQ
jgi:C1A family cysteine protease